METHKLLSVTFSSLFNDVLVEINHFINFFFFFGTYHAYMSLNIQSIKIHSCIESFNETGQFLGIGDRESGESNWNRDELFTLLFRKRKSRVVQRNERPDTRNCFKGIRFPSPSRNSTDVASGPASRNFSSSWNFVQLEPDGRTISERVRNFISL